MIAALGEARVLRAERLGDLLSGLRGLFGG